MERPVTSKPRGICRYYTTPKGCYNGDSCKFLHGANERLTPYDKSKVCRYHIKGYCSRGDQCWFRHELVVPSQPTHEQTEPDAGMCSICLEKPVTYGLLTGCSHVFCLQCIRQWRATEDKSLDMVTTGVIKSCPLCRRPSRFVTPSTHFFPSDHPKKTEIIEGYRASMARVPCKYFVKALPSGKPCCPFGDDCFYQHAKADGSRHAFNHGAEHFTRLYRTFRPTDRPRARSRFRNDLELLQHLFEDPANNLHFTLDIFQARLPAILQRFGHDDMPSDTEPTWPDLPSASDDLDNDGDDENDPFTAPGNIASDQTIADSPDSPSQFAVPPSLPSPRRPQSIRRMPILQFGTIVNSRSQEALISGGPVEEESIRTVSSLSLHEDHATDTRGAEDRTSPPLPCTRANSTATSAREAERIQTQPNVEPPFLTDGRGRVVWSSACDERGTPGEGR